MERIHIRTILAQIDLPGPEGQPLAFSLDYYKTDGSKGHKPAVRKGGQAGGGTGSAGGSSKFKYNLKEKGTLQLINCEDDEPFALKIILLCGYNGQPILHG